MNCITLTEAITELASGSRQKSVEVVRANIAELEAWEQRFRELSISAHLAAAEAGRDLDFYRSPNPLVVIEHPAAVAALFAACAKREQLRADADRAFSLAARRIIEVAAAGRVDVFGRFGGRGEAKAIPTFELHQLAFFPDFGLDVLAVRGSWETWSHVLVDEMTFGTWLDGERQKSDVRDQAETTIVALQEILITEPRVTAKAARALLKEQHGIDLNEEDIKRDLLPIARARSGLEPRGPGRPPKSGPENREKK